MSGTKRNKWLRITLVVIGLLLVVGIGISMWLAAHYKEIVKKRLPGIIAKATDSLYKVSVEDISISLLQRNVTITNIKFWPDTTRLAALKAIHRRPKAIFELTVPSVEATGINWSELIAEKEFSCANLIISKPKIVVTSLAADSLADTTKVKKKQKIEQIRFGSIKLKEPDITYKAEIGDENSTLYGRGGSIELKDWVFDPQEKAANNTILFAKSAAINLDTVYTKTKDGLYNISTGGIQINSEYNAATIKNFRVKSAYSQAEYYKRTGMQKDIFDVHFPAIGVEDLKIQELVANGALIASNIKLDDASVEIFFSRLPPPNTLSKMGNFPNQLIQKLKLPIYIRNLAMSDGHFKYTELNKKTMKEGSFRFEDIKGEVKNVTNMDSYLAKSKECIISMTGAFMGKSHISATFNLSLTDTNGAFSVKGSHDNIDAAQLRKMVQALALVDIKSFNASRIIFNVSGNQYGATGQLTMLYKNLEVELLKVEGGGDTTLKEQEVVSFLAKNVLLHDQNPEPGKPVRQVKMSQKRDPQRSFFNLIWKTIYEGVVQTAIKSENIAEQIQKPPEKKKGFLKRLFQKKDKKND